MPDPITPASIVPLAVAAKLRGLAPRTLRSAIERGRLKGEKSGRDWFVKLRDVEAYLKSRDGRGARPRQEVV
jgi:excisionase family DNA binding protein